MGLKMEYIGADGRKCGSTAEMLSADLEKILDDCAAAIERAVTSTRCPIHNQNATVAVQRSGRPPQLDDRRLLRSTLH